MSVRVFLNHLGKRLPVGLLAMAARGLAFEYCGDFLQRGIELSPYFLPLRSGVFCDEKQTLNGVHGVFSDSLPDGWGLFLMSRVMRHGRPFAEAGLPERLAFAGSRGPGALEYGPDASFPEETPAADLDALARETQNMLRGQGSPHTEELLQLSGFLSGVRPKVCLQIPEENGGTGAWIVKFRAPEDRPDAGYLEYQYSLAAARAGIDMPETRLFPSGDGAGYFGVRRFDRTAAGQKVHVHTACGLLHAPILSYENLLRLTADLTKNRPDTEQMVRRMIFNVLAGNRDDHAKNFSFCMDAAYRWHLAPAYDITPSSGMNGEHCAAVNGKGRDIGEDDLVRAAAVGGLRPRAVRLMIEQTCDALAETPGTGLRCRLSSR